MQHQPRKRFGQNFLVDYGIIDKIVRAINPQPNDNLVEIGPGQAALTEPLLQQCQTMQVVEIDRDLAAFLAEKFPNLTVNQGDALKFDFSTLASGPRSLRIVGNLPYNISTPLIFHLLDSVQLIKDMHFMLQKEVVERLAASPGNKNYGRLSVMVQYYCTVDNLFHVPPECFHPRPKVDSAIVRLAPHSSLPATAENLPLLRKLVAGCFQQRRKTLRNGLRSVAPLDVIGQLDFDISRRPDQLSVADYVQLSNLLSVQFSDQLLK